MKNILMIDDHLKHLADLLKQLMDLAAALIGAGYQVIPTTDPESGIACIHQPHLMIFPYFLYG